MALRRPSALLCAVLAVLMLAIGSIRALPATAAAPSSKVTSTSYLWPKAKKVSSRCSKSAQWPSTARHYVLRKTSGTKKVAARVCMHAAQDVYLIDITKVNVTMNKAARAVFTGAAKVRIKLADQNGQGQWVDWQGSLQAGTSWWSVGLPAIPAHPLDNVVVQTWVIVAKKSGGSQTFFQQRKVYNTGFKAGIK